jgi:hypothetical protein
MGSPSGHRKSSQKNKKPIHGRVDLVSPKNQHRDDPPFQIGAPMDLAKIASKEILQKPSQSTYKKAKVVMRQ